jgi:aspartyl-tRNA(Asn)/glutamyl-tRNA(Gln) amidotransferase subunit A
VPGKKAKPAGKKDAHIDDGLSIASFHDTLVSGQTSVEERTREELSNIASYSKELNAFITVFDGHEGLALSRARLLDERMGAEEAPESPLYGVPLTIKDNVFFGGFVTTCGSKAFTGFVPETNADLVDQMLGRGCVPLGKTNLHELALGIMGTGGYGGPIHNPVDPSRISGGSSGGSAVSVARSEGAILSIGSDTGGSVRVPAALCGVTGFKPSRGVLSTEGVFPLSGSLDHLGLFAKTVPDVALAFRTITDTKAGPRRTFKVGVPDRFFVDDMDPQVSRAFWGAVDQLKSSGAFNVKQVHIDDDYRPFAKARAVITLKESSWFYESVLRSADARKMVHADVFALMDSGLRMGMIRYMRAMNVRADSIVAMSRLLDGLDALLMPTSLVVAPKIEDVVGHETGDLRTLLLRNTELFNLSGQPALSMPARRTKGELPVGLQFVGKLNEDASLLSVSESAWSVLHAPASHE